MEISQYEWNHHLLQFVSLISVPFFKTQENACARCMLKACICCLWCLEKCLAFLNQVSKAQCDGSKLKAQRIWEHSRSYVLFRMPTLLQPSTAPVSAPQPVMPSLSWWPMPFEWPPLTPLATLSSSWERYSCNVICSFNMIKVERKGHQLYLKQQ